LAGRLPIVFRYAAGAAKRDVVHVSRSGWIDE
jgi:hypothetical protein